MRFGDVEDELRLRNGCSPLKGTADNEAVTSSRRTLDIANNRYKAGLVTYLDVATARRLTL